MTLLDFDQDTTIICEIETRPGKVRDKVAIFECEALWKERGDYFVEPLGHFEAIFLYGSSPSVSIGNFANVYEGLGIVSLQFKGGDACEVNAPTMGIANRLMCGPAARDTDDYRRKQEDERYFTLLVKKYYGELPGEISEEELNDFHRLRHRYGLRIGGEKQRD